VKRSAKRAAGRKGISPARALAFLLVAAVVVRAIYLVQLTRFDLSSYLSLDAQFYYNTAHDIAAGNPLPPGGFAFNPFYPLFLVLLFKLFGEGMLAPRIIQLGIGLATIALIFAAGRRLAPSPGPGKSRKAALAIIAAAMAILYSKFTLYEGMLVATTFEVFFLTASFVLALALDQDLAGERAITLGKRRVPPWLSSLALGATCGAGALGRPNLFFLLIAALIVWLLARSRGTGRGMIRAASLLAGAAIFLAPPIAYNAKVTGRFVPVTSGGGINFYIGNSAGSTGIFHPPDDMRGNVTGVLEDMRPKAEAETGRHMTQSEASDYYFRKALHEIGRDPVAWLKILGTKLVLYFNTEVPDLPDAYLYERSCGILKFLFLPFSVIATLGVCGLTLFLRTGRNRSIVSVFLGCAVASVVIFFVNERYRFPVIPILILLAAFAVTWAADTLAARQVRKVAILAVAAALFFVVVPRRPLVKTNHSGEYAVLGKYYLERKDEAKAAEAFAEAYRLAPNKPEAIMNYARILRQTRRYQESAAMYARAHAVSPQYPLLAAEYGLLLERLGRRSEAKKLYLEAASSKRGNEHVLACRLLAEALIAEGDKSEAAKWVRQALETVPGEPELTRMLEELEGKP